MKLTKHWVIAASLAAMVAANGIVFAAAGAQPAAGNEKKEVFVTKDGHQRGVKFAFKGASPKLLEFLKIDAATFKSERQAGKTLAAIAGERGISEQRLRDFMVAQMAERIDDSVKAGKLGAEQAEKMKARLADGVTKMIHADGPVKINHKQRAFADGELLSLLGIDKDTLVAEMKAGKTLVAIAGERGVSEQRLRDFMVAKMGERIDESVKAGKLDAERAEKMKAGLEERVAKMINANGPVRIVHKVERGSR
jgi:predicted transcriptional regulator